MLVVPSIFVVFTCHLQESLLQSIKRRSKLPPQPLKTDEATIRNPEDKLPLLPNASRIRVRYIEHVKEKALSN